MNPPLFSSFFSVIIRIVQSSWAHDYIYNMIWYPKNPFNIYFFLFYFSLLFLTSSFVFYNFIYFPPFFLSFIHSFMYQLFFFSFEVFEVLKLKVVFFLLLDIRFQAHGADSKACTYGILFFIFQSSPSYFLSPFNYIIYIYGTDSIVVLFCFFKLQITVYIYLVHLSGFTIFNSMILL